MATATTESSVQTRAARPWFRRLWYAAVIGVAVAPPIGAVGYMLYSGLLAHETYRFVACPTTAFTGMPRSFRSPINASRPKC